MRHQPSAQALALPRRRYRDILDKKMIRFGNHLDQARLQLTRSPRPLPTLRLNPQIRDLDAFRYEDFVLENYEPQPHIKAEVAV